MAKRKVGITGGIGSGKSYCARIFGWLGVPVYYADERARELMRNDYDIKNKLINLLGPDVYDHKGNLHKEFLRNQIFGSPGIRQSINAIVHPVVGKDYLEWHKAQEWPYTLNEAALLVETGLYKQLDHLIMVQAPRVIRIQRIIYRDQLEVKAVDARMKSQLPNGEKAIVSNLFIDNSGCVSILDQVLFIHKMLINLS